METKSFLISVFVEKYLGPFFTLNTFLQSGGSGMFNPDPKSWFLPIPNPGSINSNKREGWKNLFCHNFLCSHKFLKIANYFSFGVLKKNIWANFQRIIEFFTQKLSQSSQKYGFGIRDPRSGIRKKPIPDPGSRGQKGTGSRIPDPDPQHCFSYGVTMLQLRQQQKKCLLLTCQFCV